MNTNSSLSDDGDNVMAWVKRLAFDAPNLTDLTSDQLAHIANFVVVAKLSENLKRLVDLARIDLEAEWNIFLKDANMTKSFNTVKTYVYSIARIDEWTFRKNIEILDLTPRQADEYIRYLRDLGRAPGTIRLDVSGIRSFFTFLERRFDVVRNPFRGTKALPRNVPFKELIIPTPGEVTVILEAADPFLRAAIACLSGRGLRVGALQSLRIEDGRFSARSKARVVYGRMPEMVLEAIRSAGLNEQRPFFYWRPDLLSGRIRAHFKKLAAKGVVRATFSPHDLRHFYAVTEYNANADIYRLKSLMCHANVSTTERYLRGLQML